MDGQGNDIPVNEHTEREQITSEYHYYAKLRVKDFKASSAGIYECKMHFVNGLSVGLVELPFVKISKSHSRPSLVSPAAAIAL